MAKIHPVSMPHRSTEELNESMTFSKSLATRCVGQNQLTTKHYAR